VSQGCSILNIRAFRPDVRKCYGPTDDGRAVITIANLKLRFRLAKKGANQFLVKIVIFVLKMF